MRITFDPVVCTGHGRCYALAPEIFDADDQGHCVVLIVGDDDGELPPALEATARAAVANCPEGALRLV